MPVYGLRARRLGVEDLVHVERALLAEVLQAFTSLEGALGPESLVLEQWQTTVVEAPKRDEVGRQRDTERLFYCGDGFGARRFEAADRTGNVLLHPLHDPRNRGADPVILRRCGPLRRRLLHDRHVFLGGPALFGGGGLSWRGALFGGGGLFLARRSSLRSWPSSERCVSFRWTLSLGRRVLRLGAARVFVKSPFSRGTSNRRASVAEASFDAAGKPSSTPARAAPLTAPNARAKSEP